MLLSKRFLGTHTHTNSKEEDEVFRPLSFSAGGCRASSNSPPPPQPFAPALVMPVSTARSQVGAANKANPLPSGGEGGWWWRGRWRGGQGGRSAAAKGSICISGPPATQGNPNTGLFSFFFSRGVGDGTVGGRGAGGVCFGVLFLFCCVFCLQISLGPLGFRAFHKRVKIRHLYKCSAHI